MISASPVESHVNHASPHAVVLARRADTDDLGETIAALAARLHAATYELLVLLREFDERSGWNNGFLSCAHWLHWRTGIDLGASREKVRVAKALPVLPRISAAMQHGQVSYAKVRALTRVATPENERSLLDLALAGNCAHVERFVRAWRRVDRAQAAHETETKHLHRQLSTWVDDDGMVVIRGRLTPEVGAVVQRALEAAADRLFRDTASASRGDAMTEELTPAQRRADALALLAESAMAAHFDGGTAGDRYQVVLHASADDAADTRIDSAIRSASPATLDGVIEVDHGALYVSTETSQRLSCDASLVQMRHDADGAVLDVGRKTRTILPSTRRALAARDTGCRFPGCTSRRSDAHHIKHWADGGATRLDNLVLLCRRHHRAVHEGGFAVIRGLDGVLTFLRPDGKRLHVVPPAPPDLPGLHDTTPRVTGTLPTWDGTRFDLPGAIDVLYRGPVVPEHEIGRRTKTPGSFQQHRRGQGGRFGRRARIITLILTITPGSRLGVYQITALLGEGGMGQVFRARDTKLDRDVAIKVLPETFAHDAERMARFTREAKTLASLNHPNIAAIYGLEESGPSTLSAGSGQAGSGQAGMHALVMELVEGEDLSQRIARLRAPGASARQAGMPLDEALPIAKQIAEALEAAHEQGIVHRDLKPANIKVRSDGTVKVLDFGLAKALDPAAASSAAAEADNLPTITSPAQMTGVGVILGTAAYMAPEQARGTVVDKRADVWAFGVVLFEMLTGQRLFAGATVSDTLAAVLTTEPDWTMLPAGTPAPIRRLLRRCLEKDRKRRLDSAAGARLEIDDALTTPSAVEGTATSTTTSASRGRLAWIVAAAAVVAAAGLAIPAARHLREVVPDPLPIRFEIQPPPTDDPLSFAVSPDGRQLAFVATSDGKASRLWIRSLDQTQAQPLTGTDGASYPFWSPDSRTVGFFAGGRLKRIDSSGGAALDLATAPIGRGGTWNREGIILFTSDPRSGLTRVAATGGPTSPVAREGFGQPAHGPRFPQFLPDGRRFLCYLQFPPPELRGVYLGSLDGGDMVRVLVADTMVTYAPPGYLLEARQGQLVAWSFNAAQGVVSGDPVPIASDVGSNDTVGRGAFSASETGVLVHRAATSAQRRQLTWVDRAGRVLSTVGSADDTTAPAGPELAPDGRRVVWYRQVQGNSDAWLMDVSRGVESRFTFGSSSDVAPLWSPDGSRVVFASSRSGNFDLVEHPAGGAGDGRTLLSTRDAKYPLSWSADGRLLLYRNANAKTERQDLWVLPLTGDKLPFPVVQTNFDETEGQFSPDGRWLAYVSNESRRFEVMVRPFPGSGETVQVSAAGGSQVRWRPDGTELFYIAPDARLMAVSIAARTGSQALVVGAPVPLFSTRLATGANVTGAKPQYAVAPDGRFLLNARVDEGTSPPFGVVINWTDALKGL